MTGAIAKPFYESRDERRARLVAHFAAIVETLLEEDTYTDISVERLIRAAGISRGTFYGYFSDKTELLVAMANHLIGTLDDVGADWWTMDETAGKEDLRRGLRRILATWREHRVLLRAITEASLRDAGVRDAYKGLVDLATSRTEAHIRAGQATGSVAPVEPHVTAKLLMYLAERSLYEFLGVDDVQTEAEYLDPLTDVFWRALYAGHR